MSIYMATNLTKKYVIGTHVMWFEIEMYQRYGESIGNRGEHRERNH